jgi:hypothetical protein
MEKDSRQLKAFYIRTNQELVAASANSQSFFQLVQSIHRGKRPLNVVNISTLLQKTGKLRLRLDDPLVYYLSHSLQHLCPDDIMTGQHVGNSLYGLQNMTNSSDAVKELILSLALTIDRCEEKLTAQAVGNALYGLQRMENSKEIRLLLRILIAKIEAYAEPFNSQAIGNSLYGLQRIGECLESRRLLAVLNPRVQHCRDRLKGQEVGNALHGLLRFTDCKEARDIVATLTVKVHQCTEELKPQEISHALHALQNLGDTFEVRQLIMALTPKVRQCRHSMLTCEVGKALYGMQCLGDSQEARQLLLALVPHISNCNEETNPGTPSSICNMIFGLKEQGDSKELRLALKAVARKIDEVKPAMTNARVIAKSFHGMARLADSKEACELMAALVASTNQFLRLRRVLDVYHVFVEHRKLASQHEVRDILDGVTRKLDPQSARIATEFLEDVWTLNDFGEIPEAAQAYKLLTAKAEKETPSTLSDLSTDDSQGVQPTRPQSNLQTLYDLFADEEPLFDEVPAYVRYRRVEIASHVYDQSQYGSLRKEQMYHAYDGISL